MGVRATRIGRFWPSAVLWGVVGLTAAGLWPTSELAAAGPDLRLVTAAAQQDAATVRALIDAGADVNAARADGVTALLWAAHWNDVDTVELLLRAGANANAAEDHGVTALARAAENANEAIVARLLRANADVNAAQTSGLTPLMIASRTGNVNVVTQLLAAGANVNAITKDAAASALMWAVGERHRDIVKLLLDADANAHQSTSKGFTSLMYAARNGDIETAKLLIVAGVSPNETGSDGTAALPYALVNEQGDFAMFLLDQGADPNGAMGGVPALHAAAAGVNTWLGDWFRRHGDDSKIGVMRGGVFVGGGGGLNVARRTEAVKALIAHGADVNARITTSALFMSFIGYPTKGAFELHACGTGDLMGATPLWVAAYAANGSVGGFGGADDLEGENMLVESSAPIVNALLEAGADLTLATDDGTTPLMVAAGLGRSTFQPGLQRGRRSLGAEEVVNILLDAGADINAINEADFTALHGAAFRGLDEVIEILVRRGADIDARDFRGRTAYRLAEGSKQSFQFQAYPGTAEFINALGANTRLGIPGTVHERLRDVGEAIGAEGRQ